MNNLLELFQKIDELTEYLRNRGFPFSEEGYPVFSKEMFLTSIPDLAIPINHRKDKRVVDKSRTLLVYYCGDRDIYRRLDKLFSEIEEYKAYMGVVGCDITVTRDMDLEWQRAIMLLNLLIMAVFCVNGIKVVMNTRMGSDETIDLFRYIPRGIMVASGFRGSGNRKCIYDYKYLSKILKIMPDTVLIYGKCRDYIINQLNDMGIRSKQYSDFRNLCKEVK